MVMFVAAQRFTGGPVDAAEPVEPAPDQHGVHSGRRQAKPAGDLYRTEAVAPPQATIRLTTRVEVFDGQWCGREVR